jgi:hypothetical protein
MIIITEVYMRHDIEIMKNETNISKKSEALPYSIFKREIKRIDDNIKNYMRMPYPMLPHLFFLSNAMNYINASCLELTRKEREGGKFYLDLHWNPCDKDNAAQFWTVNSDHALVNFACTTCTLTGGELHEFDPVMPKEKSSILMSADGRCLKSAPRNEGVSLKIGNCISDDNYQIIYASRGIE